MTDIEKYMKDNGIVQITMMPEQTVAGVDGVAGQWFPEQYSVVIGNNRYFGFTIEEAVRKAQ